MQRTLVVAECLLQQCHDRRSIDDVIPEAQVLVAQRAVAILNEVEQRFFVEKRTQRLGPARWREGTLKFRATERVTLTGSEVS